MASMNFDEDWLLEEPCISCNKCYIDNLFYEWCCDEKECQLPELLSKDEGGGRMNVMAEVKITILDGEKKGMVHTFTTTGETQPQYTEIGIIERLRLEWNNFTPYSEVIKEHKMEVEE